MGIDSRLKDAMPPKKVSARMERLPGPSAIIKVTMETKPRAKAMGVPIPRQNSSPNTTIKPAPRGVMIAHRRA